MSRRKTTAPANIRIAPHETAPSHAGFSIGPASTPDIFSHPPPITSKEISSALLRSTSQASGGKGGKSWDRGEWVGSPTLHVGEGLGGIGIGLVDVEAESAAEEDEEETVVEPGVEWVGWALLVGSVTCWVLGVWSMMIAPFVDTSASRVFDLLAEDAHYKYLLVLLVPVTLYAVIINWWGLKIFRHA